MGAIELDGEAWVRRGDQYMPAVPVSLGSEDNSGEQKKLPAANIATRTKTLGVATTNLPSPRNYRRPSNLFLSAFRAPIQQAADQVIGPWRQESVP
ncbi:hypothetical protein TrVFT333_011528 [Trichoderma virens FT-333]|nr:hypothetical protein TrVFT333_011528 [Trichoderma virens FT-333]